MAIEQSLFPFVELKPAQNYPHITDYFEYLLLSDTLCILIQMTEKFVPKSPIDNKSALVQEMAWRRAGNLNQWRPSSLTER